MFRLGFHLVVRIVDIIEIREIVPRATFDPARDGLRFHEVCLEM